MKHEPHEHGQSAGGHQHAVSVEKSKDPVCGMTVDPAKAAASCEHEGVAYYFCSKGCLGKFRANPAQYLAKAAAAAHASGNTATDPVCGMKVDPQSARASADHQVGPTCSSSGPAPHRARSRTFRSTRHRLIQYSWLPVLP